MRAIALIVLIASFLCPGFALAETITGNPSTDGGWVVGNNALNSGTYIRGAGNYGFAIYTKNYNLQAGSPLLTGGPYAWSVGDHILAVGGVMQSTNGVAAGWGSAFTGNAVNSNLTYSGPGGATSTRVVSKFGATPTAWTTSTVKPDLGNGLGSFSAGHGANGSILLGTDDYTFSPANEGALVIPLSAQRYQTVGGVVNLDTRIGRVTTDWSGSALVGFETFLNLTLLQSQHVYADYPAAGDRIDQAMQRGSSSTLFTDGLITLTSDPPVVPLPTSAHLGLLLLAAIFIVKILPRSLRPTT